MKALLQFRPHLFERPWGGRRLPSLAGAQDAPAGPIGEAWLLADHPKHASVVADGPLAGRAISNLLDDDERGILGTLASRTRHGRFPLMLKLIEAAEALSVQVHPDDATAAELGEDDVGKTEMWHVLEAASGAPLYCGISPEIQCEDFARAIAEQRLDSCLEIREVAAGDSVFVAAGTVHAIGGGILLAEIQQNSNVTYRVYDWGRVGADGRPRALHVEKALRAIHFGVSPAQPAIPLAKSASTGGEIHVLAACRHFATEKVALSGECPGDTCGSSFHLLLPIEGDIAVETADACADLHPGAATLVPAGCGTYALRGQGVCLRYYVPGLTRDIIAPLRDAGHGDEDIRRLAGPSADNDLAVELRHRRG